MPAVAAPPGISLPDYAGALFDRYANPAIRHRTWQIAMDGSQKLPQRLLGTLRENIAAGRESPALCLAVAGWMRYVAGTDETGGTIDVRDPLADLLRDTATDAAPGTVTALLSLEQIFPADLAAHLAAPAMDAASLLWSKGARAAAAQVTS